MSERMIEIQKAKMDLAPNNSTISTGTALVHNSTNSANSSIRQTAMTPEMHLVSNNGNSISKGKNSSNKRKSYRPKKNK